jgi:hypothetical protein
LLAGLVRPGPLSVSSAIALAGPSKRDALEVDGRGRRLVDLERSVSGGGAVVAPQGVAANFCGAPARMTCGEGVRGTPGAGNLQCN